MKKNEKPRSLLIRIGALLLAAVLFVGTIVMAIAYATG